MPFGNFETRWGTNAEIKKGALSCSLRNRSVSTNTLDMYFISISFVCRFLTQMIMSRIFLLCKPKTSITSELKTISGCDARLVFIVLSSALRSTLPPKLILVSFSSIFAEMFHILLSREKRDIAITFVCLSVCLFVC